jgi:hypothetical protein
VALPNRLEKLRAQNQVTGIDFVYVFPNQTTLDVYFLRSPATLAVPLVSNLLARAIRIYSPSGGEWLPEVPVSAIAWVVIGGLNVLRITTTSPGDFSLYRLHIEDARIDPYFNDVRFNFKANCCSDLDCAPAPHECPADPPVDFPVDYTARDFWSFRQALLDFAAQRYPAWQDRLEADAGVMLAEVMSAVGDEFAYYQDRVAREAYLETASQRRSMRRLARLVDYNIHDGLGASAWLDFTVSAPGTIPAGTLVTDPDGKVHFEVGQGMNDSFPVPALFAVDNARNVLHPHLWDENDTCLPIRSTELYIEGHHTADLPLDDTPPEQPPGKWLLLQTFPTNPEVQARAFMVRLIARQDTNDPVLLQPLTRLQWEDVQATPFELDLETLEVHGNLLRATSGRTISQRFTIGPSFDENDRPSAIERAGPDGMIAYMFSLPGSDQSQLVWLGPNPKTAAPEVRLTSRILVFGTWVIVDEWKWTRAPLGTVSAQPNDLVFTLDDGFWQEVVKYQRIGNDIVHKDYATGLGVTVRFGDNQFGAEPAIGTVFEADFRLDGGLKSKVATGTLTRCPMGGIVQRVTNPLPAIDGVDPESPEDIRRFAPEAFRAITFRAVRPEDYAEAAERLPWVLRAGCGFRWTGSWIDAFVTPDPRGSFTVTAPERIELERQIDRFRQAGRPAYVLDPRYANLDLIIAVCVEVTSFNGEVKKRVLEALFGHGGIRPSNGFFSHDNFTFGTPLERSRLEAAIQEVSGVRAVEEIQFRRRGWFDWRILSELTYRVGDNELIRVENDPNLPERGSVTLDMRGGA